MSTYHDRLNFPKRPRTDARLLCITRAKHGAGWHGTMRLNACTLFYIISGAGAFRLDGERFPILQDDFILVTPHEEHLEISSGTETLEYIALGIDGLDFVSGGGQQPCYIRIHCRGKREEMLFYLKALLSEMETKPASYDIVCQDLLEVLLVKLLRHMPASVTVSASKKSSRECAAIKRYIDSRYKENITLDTLASLTHMNKYYLVHVFHRENGISPISYLIRRRIRESKNLLKNTNHTLSQISQMLGFSSQSYFSQSFKKQENMSPNEYRKLAKKNLQSEEKP